MLTRDDLAKARYWATYDYGYLAPIIVAFNFIEVKNAPFPWVACDRNLNLYYNPDAHIQDEADLPVFLLHETLHILMGHSSRGDRYKGGSKDKINCAADMEINDNFPALIELAKKVGGILADRYNFPRDRTFEEYYELLQDVDLGSKGQGRSGKGESGQSGSEPNDGQEHDCGSCTGGPPRDYEKDPEIQKQQNNRGETEVQAIVRDAAEKIIEHNKYAGQLPAGLVLVAKKIVDRPVPWYQLLPQSIRGTLASRIGNRVDHSNRFKEKQDIFIRKLREPEPKLVVMVDTSGSMDSAVSKNGRAIDYAYSKIHEVARQMGVKTVVLSGDTFVQAKSSSDKPKLVGGGGTDMAELINYADKHYRNSTLVLLTDGYTGYPEKKPKNPLIVGIIAAPEQKGPAYAKTIHIPVREREIEGR